MIPKIIHYCWFGRGEMPPLSLKCLESWRLYLPDYTLQLWNEDSFDINSSRFVKEAYLSKKYAFVTDVVRLWALYNYGGVYMDTDVEILKDISTFLKYQAFTGFETDDSIPTGIMGSEQYGLWAEEQLKYYENISFIRKNGGFNARPNVQIITESAFKYNFVPNNQYQVINNYLHVFPKDYFCPKSYLSGNIELTENTFCIHHFAGSWHNDSKFAKKLKSWFGETNGMRVLKLYTLIKKQFYKFYKI